MPTFEAIRQEADDRNLVRKIQKAVAFLAPTSVVLPESLYASGSLIDLKTLGFLPIGLITPDGYSFAREVEKEDVNALGYASPIRSDVTTVARSVTFTAMEKGRRHLSELIYGTDLSGTTQDPVTGEVVFDEPDLPVGAEYRFLALGSDGPADANWILGKGYGLVKLATTGEESWGQEGAVQQELTLDIFTDDALGTPVRHYMGGTGALAHKDVLGYTAAPAAVPTITSALPSGAVTGDQVTIKGTGFTGATAVAFGAVNAPTFTVTDSTTIVVTVPSSTAGTVMVTVTNATGTSVGFSYTRGA